MGLSSETTQLAAAGGVWVGAVLLLLSCLLWIALQQRPVALAASARRTWRIACAIVLALQALAIVYAGLALVLGVQPVLIPATRWSADTLSWIVLLGAACLASLTPRGKLVPPILAGVASLAGLGYAVSSLRSAAAGCSPTLWPAGSCPPPAGILLLALIVGLAVSASACAWLIVRRPPAWRWLATAAGSLGIAVFLDLALARSAWPPGPFSLLAFVLLLAQFLFTDFVGEPAAPPPPGPPSPASTSPAQALRVAVDFAHLMQAESTSDLADAAVKATALATRVEFVLLVSPPDDRGRFSAAKGYDHIRERPLAGFSMHGRSYPAIQEALVERRILEVTDDPKPPDLAGLMDEMEAYESGTLLLLPILAGEALRAGLLLFSPFAQRRWSAEEKAQLVRLCSLLADRFAQLDRPWRTPAEQQAADERRGGPERVAPPARAWKDQVASGEAQSDELVLVLQELAEARAQLALLSAEQQARASTSDQLASLRGLSARLEQGLRSASSYSGLLLDDVAGMLTGVQRKYLERLHTGLARSQELAQDLRDRLAPGSEAIEEQGECAVLDTCLQQVLGRYTVALREHQLRLQLDLPERSPILRAEPSVLEQVLDNLLANALAVTPDGEDVTVSAHVIRDAGSSYMLLDVADHGPGIATEHLGMVFEPQVAADARRPAGIQDGGAGLPLVKRLCEAAGGRIWVDSRPGYGTTYTALLPLASGETGTSDRPMTSEA